MKKRPAVKKATEIPFLLFLLGVLLFVFQYVSLEKFNVLPPGVSYRTISQFLEVVDAERIDLDFTDGLLLILIFVLGFCLVALELWKRRLSLFLDRRFLSLRLDALSDGFNIATKPDWKLISTVVQMLNVKYLLATQDDQDDVKIIDLPSHSPILVSSRIVLEPHLSPLRRMLLVVDLMLIGMAVWIWVRERKMRIPRKFMRQCTLEETRPSS